MEAVIFCGIQASGKSSFYKERFFKSHVHISLDLLRTRNRENLFLEVCFKTQQAFVVDNTNPTAEERRHYISKAKAFDYRVIGYYFKSDLGEALERNSRREGKEYISEIGIKATSKKLKVPTYEEGFDELYYVELQKDKFVIKTWSSM